MAVKKDKEGSPRKIKSTEHFWFFWADTEHSLLEGREFGRDMMKKLV